MHLRIDCTHSGVCYTVIVKKEKNLLAYAAIDQDRQQYLQNTVTTRRYSNNSSKSKPNTGLSCWGLKQQLPDLNGGRILAKRLTRSTWVFFPSLRLSLPVLIDGDLTHIDLFCFVANVLSNWKVFQDFLRTYGEQQDQSVKNEWTSAVASGLSKWDIINTCFLILEAICGFVNQSALLEGQKNL